VEINRIFAGLGGIFGAAGIAAYAAAAHGDAGHMSTIAPILFIHAPAFLALSPLAKLNRAALFGGVALVLGLLFFIGDLILLEFAGQRLFPFAAPLGGSLLIVGWIIVTGTAFKGLDFRRRT
jgi:uncharacterized membrane protein YgdD (TMEM256/DUF423 family)